MTLIAMFVLVGIGMMLLGLRFLYLGTARGKRRRGGQHGDNQE